MENVLFTFKRTHLMKFFHTFLLFLFTMALGSVNAQKPDDVLGKWLTGEANSHIEIYKEAGKDLYFGKIVWLKDPIDENGKPTKDDKGQPIMGMINLRDFAFNDNEWGDGTIYDPKEGKTYYCTLELDGPNKLKVRGSVDSFGLIGRTDVWTRVK